MTDAIVLGNGESRKIIDEAFDDYKASDAWTLYGCNALYRDFTPDVLFANDVRMILEIVENGYCWEHDCYFTDWFPMPRNQMVKDSLKRSGYELVEVNPEQKNETGQVVMYGEDDNVYMVSVPKQHRIYNMGNNNGFYTGPLAVLKAARDHKVVYLFGFDVNGAEDFNIYKGTRNYEVPEFNYGTTMNHRSITQLAHIFHTYSNNVFYISRPWHPLPQEWKNCSNVVAI